MVHISLVPRSLPVFLMLHAEKLQGSGPGTRLVIYMYTYMDLPKQAQGLFHLGLGLDKYDGFSCRVESKLHPVPVKGDVLAL